MANARRYREGMSDCRMYSLYFASRGRSPLPSGKSYRRERRSSDKIHVACTCAGKDVDIGNGRVAKRRKLRSLDGFPSEDVLSAMPMTGGGRRCWRKRTRRSAGKSASWWLDMHTSQRSFHLALFESWMSNSTRIPSSSRPRERRDPSTDHSVDMVPLGGWRMADMLFILEKNIDCVEARK